MDTTVRASAPGATKVEPKHDFTAKLKQPSLLETVRSYVRWQQTARAREQSGAVGYPEMLMEWAPRSINLDLTTGCNYACTHCIDWDMLNSKAKYDHENLLASLQVMIDRGLRSVILIGGGEPTLYPKFREVVRFLKERGMQVAIVSNGSHNDRILDIADCLDERDWVRLSLDSGTNATFFAMHNPRQPITLKQICSWIPKIKEKNPKLQVGFSFIIVWGGAERKTAEGEEDIKVIPNIGEIVLAAQLAKEYQFDYISLKPFLTRHPNGAEVMDPRVIEEFEATLTTIRDAVKEAKALETDSFKVVESTNLRVLMDGTWENFTKQPQMCHMQAFRQVVSPLGVFNCPAHRGEAKAFIAAKDGYSGGEATFATNQSLSKMLHTFDASKECENVTCLYNSANWWMERLIQGELRLEDIDEAIERNDFFL